MECLDPHELVQLACADLGDPERALAQGHLRRCASCQSQLADLREFLNVASNLGRRRLSASRARAVMQAADELLPLDPAKRTEIRQQKQRLRTVRLVPAPAMAAAATILVALGACLAPAARRAAPPVISIEQRFEELLRDDAALTAGASRRLLVITGRFPRADNQG